MAKSKKIILDDIEALKKDLMSNLDEVISKLDLYNKEAIEKKEKKEIASILDKIDNNL